MGAETMRFLLKYLCLILTVAAGIEMQSSHAVDYAVTNTAATTPGGILFSTVMGDDDTVKALMDSATNFIWTTFPQTDNIQSVQQVTLYVEEMDDGKVIAYGTYNDENHLNYEIHLNAVDIQDFSGDVKAEITATLYHEMTHAWQNHANGNINIGLYEGIADYIVLKAGYKRSNWVEPGQGENWDDGNGVTAFFLDYCNRLREGFVTELNTMMTNDYNDNYFSDLLDELWDDYRAS